MGICPSIQKEKKNVVNLMLISLEKKCKMSHRKGQRKVLNVLRTILCPLFCWNHNREIVRLGACVPRSVYFFLRGGEGQKYEVLVCWGDKYDDLLRKNDI